MLTQRSLKRLLVLVHGRGRWFPAAGAGFSLNSVLGIKGGLVAAATHSLAKALLFTCLSGPEADGALDGEQTGLGRALPGRGLRISLRNAGHAGHCRRRLATSDRWRLYETALQIGWPLGGGFHRFFDFRADRLYAGLDPHLVGTAA
jgi:hypothetical protein